MRVLIVSEYYPRADDPALGIWAHRQARAAWEAGAEVRVLVLHRPLPPLDALRSLDPELLRRALAQPRTAELDGLRIDYLRYVSPPRPWSYASWGAWAAPVLRRALRRIHAGFPFELIHAHYAVPAGDAVRRAAPGVPLVLSVHGGDVHGRHAATSPVRATLAHAELVLANSAGTARRCAERGAAPAALRVVHLGGDRPAPAPPGPVAPEPAPGAPVPDAPAPGGPLLVTVGNLIERKRHADVLTALATLRERHPGIRYAIVGDGPAREPLARLATTLGISDLVEFRGRLAPPQAVALARTATLFVLPSVGEAFGVSYVEAMAAGVPALGCRGEDGPEEIAAAGGGLELVAPRDPAALATRIDLLLRDGCRRERMGRQARGTVEREFSWRRCGERTVSAYREALAARGS